MSLKAKIEAVVYAAEEPVTLAQLAGLFAQEALEWKQAKEAEAAAAEAAAKAEAEAVEEPIVAVEEAPDADIQSGEASLAPPEPIAPMTSPQAETETVEQIQKRVEHDLYYIENWSVLLDLKIILRTIFGGFTGRYAY